MKIETCVIFPPYFGLAQQGLKLCFYRIPTDAISVSLTIKIHNNNIEFSRVIFQYYYKIILFQKFLSNKTDIFRKLQPNTTNFFREVILDNTSFSLRCKFFLNLFFTRISPKNAFKADSDFKKLNILPIIYLSICLFQINLTNQK